MSEICIVNRLKICTLCIQKPFSLGHSSFTEDYPLWLGSYNCKILYEPTAFVLHTVFIMNVHVTLIKSTEN